MADVKWIKIVTDIFDNRKIKQIEAMPKGDSILIVWFKLICLAGSVNDNGLVYFTRDIPYTYEMLATQINRSVSSVRLALDTFLKFGMIEMDGNFIRLPSWEKYQNTEKLDKLRESGRERVAKHRQRKRSAENAANADVTPCNAVCNVTSNADVTPCNAIDKEEDIEEELELEDIPTSECIEGGMGGEQPAASGDGIPSGNGGSPVRHKRGEYGWVLLSDTELERLLNEYGKSEVDRAIAYIDESAQSSGNKNRWKDWNLVVRRCIREGWGKRGVSKRQRTDGYAYDDSDLDFIPN